jgi:hypothetical protein
VTPSSNVIFDGPVMASDGIQDTAVTDDSMRWVVTGETSYWAFEPELPAAY